MLNGPPALVGRTWHEKEWGRRISLPWYHLSPLWRANKCSAWGLGKQSSARFVSRERVKHRALHRDGSLPISRVCQWKSHHRVKALCFCPHCCCFSTRWLRKHQRWHMISSRFLSHGGGMGQPFTWAASGGTCQRRFAGLSFQQKEVFQLVFISIVLCDTQTGFRTSV